MHGKGRVGVWEREGGCMGKGGWVHGNGRVGAWEREVGGSKGRMA